MTDHGIAPDGLQGPTALFPPPDGLFEDHQDSSEGVASGSAVSSGVSSTRRRPPRSRSDPDVSPRSASPQWVDADKNGARKPKRSRKTLRKSPGAGSPHHSLSPKPASEDGTTEKERDSIGFLPKLSRILEGRESKTVRNSRSSVVSASEKSARHRRPAKDGTIGQRSRRRMQTSLQRRAESLANLPNPSLVSVLSALTQHSHASSGSNSTVTQKSYDKGHISKRRPVQDRRRFQDRKPARKQKTMDPQPHDVFQYMEGDLEPIEPESDPRSVSPAQSSGSEEAEDSEEGSDEEQEEGDHNTNYTAAHSPPRGGTVSDTPPKLDDMASYGDDRFRSDSGVSFRKGRPEIPHPSPLLHEYAPQHPPRHEGDDDEGGEEEEEEEEAEEEEDSDSESEDHNEHGMPPSYTGFPPPPPHPGQHLTLHRDGPARMPSAASAQHSDPHVRRLRDQEQELRNHVLQPQPHRDIRFEGGFSPNTLALPLYGTHSPPTASPLHYHAAAPHPPPWTGLAPPPPTTTSYPPTTTFYPPNYIPPAPLPYAADNPHYSIATQPPMTMTAPNDALTTAPFHAQALAHHPPYAPPQPAVPDLSRTTVVGYELLADKLAEASTKGDNRDSSTGAPRRHHPHTQQQHDGETADAETPGAIVPMYRAFAQLNHRVLLHLQDEIAELEEELRAADERVAQGVPRDGAGMVYPASRRGDARFGGEPQYRRTEVLGRVYLKLGQYNQALSSFSGMLKDLDAASQEEIQRYRGWLERHAPIDSHEARFLDRRDDLLAVRRPRGSGSASTAGGGGGGAGGGAGGGLGGGVSAHQRAAVGLPLIAVLPLMAFAIVPGLLARLFILTVIGAAEVAVVTSTELMGLMTVREWFVCASIYFGFMAVLAGVTG